jgi:phosphoribosylanthranilate isomerase
MFVKICGITRIDDARAAVDAGARAVGFVFWPGSPRFIDPYRARAIVSALPPFVTAVGVFADQEFDYVSGVASLARLGAVQLHGRETPEYAAALGRPVLKAIPIDDPSRTRSEAIDDGMWPASTTLLLDVHDPVRYGGTGRTIDWSMAATVAARRPIVLAGGLTPENAAEAIARVRPFGIDVSSGVERTPGVKDHGRIRKLFEALYATSHLTPGS